MLEMVNLLVDLDERFNDVAYAQAMRGIEALGYSFYRGAAERDLRSLPVWVDEEFGGTWGSEVATGINVVAHGAGFATVLARDLRFRWLRGIATQSDVGVFGPFGVVQEDRKSGIGPHLLTAALATIRQHGKRRALIAAVGEEKLVAYYKRHCGARIVERFVKSLFTEKRHRTVVLASGNGTNFQSVLDRSRDGSLPLDIASVVCNKPDAYVLQRASESSVPTEILAWDRLTETREQYDARLLTAVTRDEPDLILLLGWMHVLDDAFVQRYGDRTINLHPAFLPYDQRDTLIEMDDCDLPAFRGAHAVLDAIAAKTGWFGATAHELSLEADRGRVLTRKPVRMPENPTIESAMAVLRPVEQQVVAGAVMRWIYER